MQNDHYVSDVYLSNFTDRNNQLHIYSKWEEKKKRYFCNIPRYVCRQEDGDILEWLDGENKLLLRKLLAEIEPKWNRIVYSLEHGHFNKTVKWHLCFYLATLYAINPVNLEGRRQVYKANVDMARLMALRQGLLKDLPQPPHPSIDIWDLDSVITVINKDFVKFEAVKGIREMAWFYYNCKWFLMFNPHSKGLVTSDNPFAIYYDGFANTGNHMLRYFPITPNMAIIIGPDSYDLANLKKLEENTKIVDLPEVYLKPEVWDIKKENIDKFNENMIKCAERFVFSNSDSKNLLQKVKKLENYRMIASNYRLDYGKGIVNIAKLDIKKIK